MKFVSWNVNGFRSVMSKGFSDVFDRLGADVFCLQETKMQPEQAAFFPEGYTAYFSSAERRGYAGTGVFVKQTPLSVTYGIHGKYCDEGRVITLDYPAFTFVCAYVPNAQEELRRLPYRMAFEDDMRAYLSELDREKPVIYTGDLNVAHREIDIKNAKANIGKAGFSYEERGKMDELLAAGFADTYRRLHPEEVRYSWWSYRFHARENNAGWRLDYFLVSERLLPSVQEADILTDIPGSDHCPVTLTLDI